jgi:hypothetical protein
MTLWWCYLVAPHVDVDLDVRARRIGKIALGQLLAEMPFYLWCQGLTVMVLESKEYGVTEHNKQASVVTLSLQ